MSERRQTIFCGSGKQVADYRINLIINVDEIPGEYITEDQRGRTVRLSVVKRKQPSEKGQTHYVEVDTWKPTPREDADPAPHFRSAPPPPPPPPFPDAPGRTSDGPPDFTNDPHDDDERIDDIPF